MNIYNYSKDTGQFISESVAEQDQLEPGKYLIPAYATIVQPLEPKDGFDIVYIDSDGNVPRNQSGNWQYKKHFVEVTAYSKETQQEKEFDDETLVTDDYTLIKPDQFQKWDSESNAWVQDDELLVNYNSILAKATRDEELSFVTFEDGSKFDSDIEAMENIQNAIDIAEFKSYEEEYSQPWRLHDNYWRETTLTELRTIKTMKLEKFEKVWTQFTAWDNGDKLIKFVYEK